jgi:small GTP-binding protein
MGTPSETPLANEYLELRAELSQALFGLAAAAAQAHAPAGMLQTLQNLQTGLREPFLFVVAGEVKAGKSSLLNAIFGQEFCRVDVLPATDRIHVFKYGEAAKEVTVSANLIERYQPIDFLRDFNIVDTPGTNTIVHDHQEITEQFVPQADLIIFVFSVVNPWGASAWEFLELLQKKWLKNVIFVLQQMDLRSPEEVEAVSQHLRQTAMQRLGQAMPIFPVSAKKALLSRTGAGEDAARLWEESRFGPLQDHINQIINGGGTRESKLKSVCQTGQVILKDLSEQARTESRVVAADREQLARLRATVGQLKQRTDLQVEGFLRGVDTAYARCQQQGEHLLEERLAFWQSVKLVFGRNEQWQIDFRRDMEAMLRTAVTKQIEHSLGLLEGELKNVWSQLHDTLQAKFGPEARNRLGTGGAEFTEQRGRLVERIEVAMMENMTDTAVDQQLQSLFSDTRSWAQLPVGAGAAGGIGVTAAIIAHSLDFAFFAGIGTLIATVVGSTLLLGKRRRGLDAYRAQMSAKQIELTDRIGDLMRQAIEVFYQKLAQVYQPLETFCNVQEERYRPLLERVDALEANFDKILARLR